MVMYERELKFGNRHELLTKEHIVFKLERDGRVLPTARIINYK